MLNEGFRDVWTVVDRHPVRDIVLPVFGGGGYVLADTKVEDNLLA